MGTLVKASRLIIKTYTQQDKDLSWQKIIKAKEYLYQAFNVKQNRDLIKSALSLYEDALKIYPEYSEIYIGLAYISFISGDINTAIAFLHNALDIDSYNKDAISMMEQFKKALQSKIQSEQITKSSNKALDKVMEIKMPVQSKVMASKTFLTSVKKAFSW